MGKILRIGGDGQPNYNLLETSDYDAENPAATTSAWSDSLATEQEFNQLPFVEVSAQGALVTFTRFPDAFLGAMVKIQPTYDTSIGENPAFEMWTHESGGDWTLRRRILLANVFVGIPSGSYGVLDLTFFPYLRNVDQVWLTLSPGDTGAPTVDFVSIHLFGLCEGAIRHPPGRGSGDPCADPTDPFYTGFDDNGDPCPGTTFGPPASPTPTLDVCNPESIDTFREFAYTIPGFGEVFDAWLETNEQAIADYCAGIDVDPPVAPTPPGSPPALPPLDLCDETSIEAFRAAVSGDAARLAQFEDFLDQNEADGFFDLVCQEPEPEEQYIDPETLEPDDDPTGNAPEPFGGGPGGQPVPAPPEQDRGPARSTPAQYSTTLQRHFFFFYAEADRDAFLANAEADEDASIQEAILDPRTQYFIFGNGNEPPQDMQSMDRISFALRGVKTGDLVTITALQGRVQGVNPPRGFVSFPTLRSATSMTASWIVNWLVERTNRLAGIPGTTVENGGDSSATVSQRQSIVTTGSTVPVLTAVTAYSDPAAGIISDPGYADEVSHSVDIGLDSEGGDRNGIVRKHRAGANAFDPPHSRSTGTSQRRLYIRLDITKRFSSGIGLDDTNDVYAIVTITPDNTSL